ncbi:MAG: GvpL/GvpF family gas vesicle protein [Anaerolineales bacterium]|nr:GvpL/GvpF family gas vesicle protein [Anaerolineales bacterium]
MARHAPALIAELERLDGRQEWGVKQVVDVAALQAALARGDEALAVAADDSIEQLRRQIAGMSPGAAFLLKKKLSSLIAERAQAIAFAVADAVHLALSDQAVEAVTNPLPQDRPDVCLNGAYLVELPKTSEFVATLEGASNQYAAAGISFELSGPWPAYHFLTLDLNEPAQSI